MRITVAVLALSLIGCQLALDPTPNTSPNTAPTLTRATTDSPSPTAAKGQTYSIPAVSPTASASQSAPPARDADLQEFIDRMAVVVYVGHPVWIDGEPYYEVALARLGSLVTLLPAQPDARGLARDGLTVWWHRRGDASVINVISTDDLSPRSQLNWEPLTSAEAMTFVSRDELVIGARGVWRVDIADGTAERVSEGSPHGVHASPSGRTIAWTECDETCSGGIARSGEAVRRIPEFVVVAVTDSYALGYTFEDMESSGQWAVIDLATGELVRSEGPRNLAWDGYAISESEFLVTESGGDRGPRLVVYEAPSMERRVIRELDERGHTILEYFNRSDRWAVMATFDFIRYRGGDWSVQVIDLETGDVAAQVALGDP